MGSKAQAQNIFAKTEKYGIGKSIGMQPFFCVPIWAEEKKIVPLYALFLTYLKRLSLIRI